MEMGTGFPGYDTLMEKDTATIAEMLKQKGWNTAWFGKNHNVPDWQSSQAGPSTCGPWVWDSSTSTASSAARPASGGRRSLKARAVEPYLGNLGYNFDYDMADQAIKWIRSQRAVAPDRPFFLYYAPGATHSPHHPRRNGSPNIKGSSSRAGQGSRGILARQIKLGIVPSNTELTSAMRGYRRGTPSTRSRRNSMPT